MTHKFTIGQGVRLHKTRLYQNDKAGWFGHPLLRQNGVVTGYSDMYSDTKNLYCVVRFDGGQELTIHERFLIRN
jgi:hypothetical protein